MGIQDDHNVIQCEVKTEATMYFGFVRTFGPFFSHVLTRAKRAKEQSRKKKKTTPCAVCMVFVLQYLSTSTLQREIKVDSRFTRMLRHLRKINNHFFFFFFSIEEHNKKKKLFTENVS